MTPAVRATTHRRQAYRGGVFCAVNAALRRQRHRLAVLVVLLGLAGAVVVAHSAMSHDHMGEGVLMCLAVAETAVVAFGVALAVGELLGRPLWRIEGLWLPILACWPAPRGVPARASPAALQVFRLRVRAPGQALPTGLRAPVARTKTQNSKGHADMRSTKKVWLTLASAVLVERPGLDRVGQRDRRGVHRRHDAEIKQLAGDIVSAQQTEIAAMKRISDDIGDQGGHGSGHTGMSDAEMDMARPLPAGPPARRSPTTWVRA